MKAAVITAAAVAMFAAGHEGAHSMIEAQRIQAEAKVVQIADEAHLPIDFAQSIAAFR